MSSVSRWFISLLCLASLLPLARGQTVEFGAAWPVTSASSPIVELSFKDVPSGNGTVGLRLALGEDLQLGVRLRQADSLATVGNFVTVLAADASTGGRYGAALTSRAVLGPMALRLRASVSDGLPPLSPVAEGAFAELPLLAPNSAAALLGLEAGASYRLSRFLIADLAPGVFLSGGTLGGRLAGELRFVRAVSENDLSLLINAFSDPSGRGVSGSVGIGYTINRRRAPDWSAAALLGWSSAGLLPGVRLAGAESWSDARLELELTVEPYRLDAWPYRAGVDYRRQLGPGQLLVTATVGLEPGSSWRAGTAIGYRLPFTR